MKLKVGDRVRLVRIQPFSRDIMRTMSPEDVKFYAEMTASAVQEAEFDIGDEAEVTGVYATGFVEIDGWLDVPADCLQKIS